MYCLYYSCLIFTQILKLLCNGTYKGTCIWYTGTGSPVRECNMFILWLAWWHLGNWIEGRRQRTEKRGSAGREKLRVVGQELKGLFALFCVLTGDWVFFLELVVGCFFNCFHSFLTIHLGFLMLYSFKLYIWMDYLYWRYLMLLRSLKNIS